MLDPAHGSDACRVTLSDAPVLQSYGRERCGVEESKTVDEPIWKPFRALIVASSESHATLILDELRRTRHEVESERVETEATMRAALVHGTWNVIFSDWSTAGFSALSALRLLKELDLQLPFVVVSGTIGDEAAFDLMREGCNDFILKDNLGRLEHSVARELREFDSRVERKRMSDELTASEARYRRIVETTNEGIWIVDERGATSFMNQQMATMLGYTLAEIGQRPMVEFIRVDASGETTRNLARSRENALKYEVAFVRSDGTEVLALIDSTPVANSAGRPRVSSAW